LDLLVELSSAGLRVAGSASQMAPGCEDSAPLGDAPTLPRTAQGQDWAGLGACLARVKDEFSDETMCMIGGEDAMPWSDVARAISVAAGSEERTLFPVIVLAM